ncbi:hypothetical protein [Pedobacter sp. HMWF019]|uniref:hypothetical protein n=1 Tax=Pedobacter sp. HMWF019 TaxID=2056856 RepID=UPI0011B296BF|nr:hypothetical protein [Pedobacter sp. HMWF019]
MNAIKYAFQAEIIPPGQKKQKIGGSVNIYYKGDIVVYEIPVFKTVDKQHTSGDTITVETEISNEIDAYRYIIYKEGEDLGKQFFGLDDQSPTQVNIQHINKELFTYTEGLFYGDNDVFKEKHQKDQNSLVEVYVPKNKPDDSYNDTTYLYFNTKFPSVKFSLDKNLDSKRKDKLTKAVLVYNGNDTHPRMNLTFEIQVALDNRIKILTEFLIKRKYVNQME